MPILKLPARTDADAASLADWGSVGLPLSEPACALRGMKMVAPIEHAPEMGMWECTPGRYRRQISSAETMHLLSGSATFTPDGGEPVALRWSWSERPLGTGGDDAGRQAARRACLLHCRQPPSFHRAFPTPVHHGEPT